MVDILLSSMFWLQVVRGIYNHNKGFLDQFWLRCPSGPWKDIMMSIRWLRDKSLDLMEFSSIHIGNCRQTLI